MVPRTHTSDNGDEAELGRDIYATVTDSALTTRTEEDVLVAVTDRAAARRALVPPTETEDTDSQSKQQEDPR
ncbi:hypothetical protein [Rhodococcus sp. SORGH_AS_0301]|uniref:hypothetical protein n=1 Tax=Rhodococcus sp. SORGH_AS_0301 TaxID=3041780 RepID=UPI002780152D|nr:hypothetical protein [Rhodococcus sp. SORGH_AS_0301]MDQ1179486.1 hypothetical protein [Rhodococcus sp. SORGH_AS_0301]